MNSSNYNLNSFSKSVANAANAYTTVPMSNNITNSPNVQLTKQRMVKGSSSDPNDRRTMGALTKKMVKKEQELVGEALASEPVEERYKSHKQVAAPLQRPSFPVAAPPPPKLEQPS